MNTLFIWLKLCIKSLSVQKTQKIVYYVHVVDLLRNMVSTDLRIAYEGSFHLRQWCVYWIRRNGATNYIIGISPLGTCRGLTIWLLANSYIYRAACYSATILVRPIKICDSFPRHMTKPEIQLPKYNLQLSQKGHDYLGMKIYNSLTSSIKNLFF